ncbi:MAG TPA: hypothetical protein VH083_21695 [Myxococcales bacterium]|nr:hypothetical protein [Myxococcales bacterium]
MSLAANASSDDGRGRPSMECHDVHAIIIDAQATGGCTTGFCAAGNVSGNLGLDGTTFYTLDGFVPGPSTAPGFNTSSGILVYTTREGTLTVRETGTGDMGAAAQSGIGASFDQILSGTGRFAGATGTFYLAQSAGGGKFTAIVTGELCLPR